MFLLSMVMSAQPLLTILEMEGEILEKGFSNNKDQIVPWQFVVGGAYKPILVFRLGFGQAVWSCMLGGIGWRVLGLLKVVWTHKTL